MPKTMPVDPAKFLKPGTLAFPQIPLHAYKTPLSEERARRGDKALVEVLRHMMVVREFETMLGSFKAKGAYQDITYAYKGPAHLSIGQEGAAVGAALELKPDDHIFGSHRSHGGTYQGPTGRGFARPGGHALEWTVACRLVRLTE